MGSIIYIDKKNDAEYRQTLVENMKQLSKLGRADFPLQILTPEQAWNQLSRLETGFYVVNDKISQDSRIKDGNGFRLAEHIQMVTGKETIVYLMTQSEEISSQARVSGMRPCKTIDEVTKKLLEDLPPREDVQFRTTTGTYRVADLMKDKKTEESQEPKGIIATIKKYLHL